MNIYAILRDDNFVAAFDNKKIAHAFAAKWYKPNDVEVRKFDDRWMEKCNFDESDKVVLEIPMDVSAFKEKK